MTVRSVESEEGEEDDEDDDDDDDEPRDDDDELTALILPGDTRPVCSDGGIPYPITKGELRRLHKAAAAKTAS